ncbi:MAG: hypothetical protein KC910_22385 [Candidatus Eremiobacteraeota bacterium]|nr:hypothetical protein [Candidatus Eremiobacteraeota bacterium]
MINLTSRVSQFVTKHIAGDKKDFVPDENATAIDNKYDQVQGGLGKISDDLDRLDQDTAVRPPALKNFKNSELMMGGALAGAAVGGSIGLGKEMLASFLSAPSYEIIKTDHDILRTSMVSAKEPWVATEQVRNDANGSIQGWQHNYEPSTTTEKVGSYTTREVKITPAGDGSPLVSGLVGMGIGAGLGLGVGAAMTVARKFIPDGAYEGGDRRETKGDTKLLVRFGLAGAAAGAAAGFVASSLEASHAQTVQYTTETPVTQPQVIGQVPQNWFEGINGSDAQNPGMRDVTANNPVMGGTIIHKPQVEKHDLTADVNGRFGMAYGVAGGAAVGLGAGVATGVLVNIIRKSI